ncbi:type IV pilin protein [Duganella violaceipulchra]|uniref:Prepilin-type N-terminal cleavage/methylation domain-containing protein n=1 Tax=Duganella violaceipulchra TaxID=2849652 RepID=A0AA41H9H7_9BURK|nr:type IV pilin protein [Duganella violaceicalia]MBV6319643.1 prepilin-type N-terminal cleavage/methylation domain-containing protein [Duganella violaceicalia]MCP2006545.1 type IV pilus assembly protein PilE [Duganella violaceicalia]
MKRVQKGFTLIEIMISVAIVGILMAVALPAYSDYVTRGRLSEAFTALGGAQPAAEQYWSNYRKYDGFDGTTTFPAATANFRYTYVANASSYTLTATGIGKMAGFVYTIDQNGTHATTGSPSGWGVSASCWVDHKGGTCSN